MAELILHHYAGSPYAEKVRLILAYKRLAWRSVSIPVVLPRPHVTPLTGPYRRTPVLQVGADVYCDTRCIARFLEEGFPEPTLYPDGSRTLSDAVAYWVEPRVFVTASPLRFLGVEDVAAIFRDQVDAADFARDRAPFMEGALDVRRIAELVPFSRDQVRGYLSFLASALDDGRLHLTGERPSLADFSAYHPLWWLAQPPRVSAALDPFPRVGAWMDRIAAIGYGTPAAMEPEEALEIARRSAPQTMPRLDPDDPAGRRPGDRIRIAADDYGKDAVVGEIVASSVHEIAIRRTDPIAGDVVVHFPRLGFQVLPAAEGVQ